MDNNVRLYVPTNISPNDVAFMLSNKMGDINPPFETPLQHIINSEYGNIRNHQLESFQLKFPRGPIYWLRNRQTSNSSNITSGVINRINSGFRNLLSTNMNNTTEEVQQTVYTPSINNIEFKCCICQDQCKIGDQQIILNCTHKFHANCIQTWLTNNRRCPICRIVV